MQVHDQQLGLKAMCVGGGHGMAMVSEPLS